MTSNVCTTCNAEEQFVVEQGYETCVRCGAVRRRELDVNNTAYYTHGNGDNNNNNNHHHYPLKNPYTRIKRFRKKIMGALQRRLNHDMNLGVLALLKQQFARKPP